MSKKNFKFKVGDRVRILDGSKIKGFTGGFYCFMEIYVGDETVIECCETHKLSGKPVYRLKGNNYLWDERGLEPIKNETIVIYREGSEVIALDKVTGKKAVAKCCPDDEFDFNTGAKLALVRLMDDEPKVKEVNRFANINEYIIITKPTFAFGQYKIGDIIRVTEIKDNTVRGFNLNNKEHCAGICKGEYVVLEGYEPPKEEKKVLFRFLCIEDSKNWVTKGKVYEAIDGCITYDCGYTSKLYENFSEWKSSNITTGQKVIELKDGDDPDEIMKKYTFYNGKVVCTGNKYNENSLTVGKIYEIKDGFFVDDRGFKRPENGKPMKSLEEYVTRTNATFIEIVE